MRVSPLEWLDQLFLCVDIEIARLLKISPPTSVDPSLATGVLTMTLVIGVSEVIALGHAMSRTVVSSSTGATADPPSVEAIIAACTVAWFAISIRCVYRGARGALHRSASATPFAEAKRKTWCVVLMLIVYAALPLCLWALR